MSECEFNNVYRKTINLLYIMRGHPDKPAMTGVQRALLVLSGRAGQIFHQRVYMLAHVMVTLHVLGGMT